jgi:hypothetical protein
MRKGEDAYTNGWFAMSGFQRRRYIPARIPGAGYTGVSGMD